MKNSFQRSPNLDSNRLKQLAILKQQKIVGHSDSI